MEPGQVDQSQAVMFSLAHNPHYTALSRTHSPYNDNKLVQFHWTWRVILTQFNYSATRWPSEGAETQKSGYWIVWYLVSAVDVSYKLWCETGLDIAAMILINTLFIYYHYVIQYRPESDVKKTASDLEEITHSSPAQLLSNHMNSVTNAVGQ